MELGADTTLAICDDGYYEINAGSGWASYLWQDGSTDSTFMVTESGEYWVTVTSPDGCPATDTIQVTIEEYQEMITEPSGNMVICQGESTDIWVTTYNGVPPYIYEWEELLLTTDTINVTPEETTVYYVTITDDCENTVTDSVKVIVIPLPELNIGNDTLICNGDSLVLNAGGGFESYLWQDGSTDSIFIVTEPGTYYVNVTGLAGCENFDGIIVNFIDIEVSIGNDTIVCEGDTVMFYAGPDFLSYQWQDGSTNPYFFAWETGYYWVEVNNNEGCSAIDSVFLLVDDTFPEVSLGSDTTICFGEPYTLNPGFFISYQWSDGTSNPTLTVYEPGDYWVIVQGGCGYAEDTVSVDYYDPVEVDIGPDSTLCFGQYLTLDAGFGFLEYLWNDGSTFQSVTVYESGTYSITVQDYLGCFGNDDAIIEIADTVNLGQDTIFCDGESVVLNAGFGFDQYTWNNGTNNQVLEVSETGNYYVDVAYVFGCPSSDSIYLEKLALPLADLGNDNDLCEGETLTLYGPEGPFEYFWNGVQGGQTLVVNQTGQYELKVSNACGEDTDTVQVNAFPIPEVYLGEDVVLMPGETLNLDAGEFEDYLWQDGTNNRYYLVSYDDYADSLYHVEVFDGHCKNADSIKIEIFDIFVPIVITPNGDGKNDIFQPDMEKWSGINQHTIQVFNRWGEKVWESNNFPQGWDGKKNGKFVAEGTYFWVLEIKIGQDNISRSYKGSLTIMGVSE
jgi:gliding motility-associated-like protein